MDRFDAKTLIVDSGCMEWTGYRDRAGYGRYKLDGRAEWAHRVAFARARGSTKGGYGGGRGGKADANRRRERIWFSPTCHATSLWDLA